jgi:hypothetical protein
MVFGGFATYVKSMWNLSMFIMLILIIAGEIILLDSRNDADVISGTLSDDRLMYLVD